MFILFFRRLVVHFTSAIE